MIDVSKLGCGCDNDDDKGDNRKLEDEPVKRKEAGSCCSRREFRRPVEAEDYVMLRR